jgi:tyrosine-protein kinase Etk/Wzc
MQQLQIIDNHGALDLRKAIGKYIDKWPWFLASLLLFLSVAVLYLRYSVPKFESTTTLKFDKKQADLAGSLADLNNLGFGLGNADELNGEVAVVNSRPILMEVVKNLNLDVEYYYTGEIKDIELFSKVPITAKAVTYKEKKFICSEYNVKESNGDNFILENEKEFVHGTFGKMVHLNFGTVILHKVGNRPIYSRYKIVFWNPLEKVKQLEKSIKVDLPDQKAMLMDISMVGPVVDKSEAILNELTEQYNLDGLKDKNLQAQNTQEFIDKRLEVITHDLSGVENHKENFQNSNHIVDLQAQAQLAIENINENTKSFLLQQTHLDLLNALQAEALKGDNRLMPSNLGLNPSLEQAISQYNMLLISRNKTLKQATNENPAVIEMNKEIVSLKEIVRENIRQQKATTQAAIIQLNKQITVEKGMVDKVPGQSKIYRGIERQQNLKEQLFLFLLQKREENAINLSVKVPKAKIVNSAYTDDIPVSPRKKSILLGAFILGLLVPFAIFYLIFIWDDKIYSREDIMDRSAFGVIGDIPSLNKSENHLVQKNDFSELAEAFRLIVSNLKFILPSKKTAKIILVTSSVKEEGKTLVSVNLALTLGNKNGKSLLIGMDIRNPQIHRYNSEPFKGKGLSDYLSDEPVSIEQLIHTSETNPNCDIIYGGIIPLNSQELLSSGRYQELINEIKYQYNYVIIDSAPLMLVADTYNIVDTADATLYVVRSGVSRNIFIDFVNTLVKESKLSNIAFVINDISKNISGYGYNYGYGYGYNADKQKSWWHKIFKL